MPLGGALALPRTPAVAVQFAPTVSKPPLSSVPPLQVPLPVTTSVTVTVWLRVPLVPVIVIVKVPVGVVVEVVTVSVEAPVVGLGLNDAVAPAGRPLAASVTEPVNPPDGVSVTVYVVLAP